MNLNFTNLAYIESRLSQNILYVTINKELSCAP